MESLGLSTGESRFGEDLMVIAAADTPRPYDGWVLSGARLRALFGLLGPVPGMPTPLALTR